MGTLRTLWRHRDLLLMWTVRDIKVRYKQSVLGVAWALLQPLALMAVFTAVFSLLVRVPSEGVAYPLFAYTALLSWTFLSSGITSGTPALVNNLSLVTKIYFPREILPLASVGAALVDFLIAGLFLVALLAWNRMPVTGAALWVPVLVGLQLVLTIGVVLPASALSVFYRDIRFVVPLALQVWLYATPVVYPVSLVPEALRPVYSLNPMVGIVDSYRRVLLHGMAPLPEYLIPSAGFSLILLVAGYASFKRAESSFADRI